MNEEINERIDSPYQRDRQGRRLRERGSLWHRLFYQPRSWWQQDQDSVRTAFWNEV